MLLGLHNAGLVAPGVYGVADNGESSILVFRSGRMPLECNLNTMSDSDMEQFMAYLDKAHRHGFTHRRITPNTLSRMEDGTPVIAGWQNGDYGSSAPNFALDKVQLLIVLSALNGVDRAMACARRTWGDDRLIDLAPFVQKAAAPAATRALPGWDKQLLVRLRDRISALAPQEMADSMEKVTLSRFSFRSFIAIALLVVAVYVVFTQVQPGEMIQSHRSDVFADGRRIHRGFHARGRRSGIRQSAVPAQKRLSQYQGDRHHECRLGGAGRHYDSVAVGHRRIHRP